MNNFEDLTGKKFGRLTVKSLKGVVKSRRIWICQCECENTKNIREDSLKKYTRSCGCLIKEPTKRRGKGNHNSGKKTHGMSNTRIYNIWAGMKQRCYNFHDSSYMYYGERGITVCNEWVNDFKSFYDWAMNNGYRDDLTIDRIDINGNYEPTNCRWATAKEQSENRRKREIIYNGESHSIAEWSQITGIKYDTLLWRYNKGWKPEKILSSHNYAIDTRFR